MAEWQKVIASPAFELACQAALAVFIESLPPGAPDPSRSWDSWLQVTVARRVLDTLSRLHEPDEPPRREPWPSLQYPEPKG